MMKLRKYLVIASFAALLGTTSAANASTETSARLATMMGQFVGMSVSCQSHDEWWRTVVMKRSTKLKATMIDSGYRNHYDQGFNVYSNSELSEMDCRLTSSHKMGFEMVSGSVLGW